MLSSSTCAEHALSDKLVDTSVFIGQIGREISWKNLLFFFCMRAYRSVPYGLGLRLVAVWIGSIPCFAVPAVLSTPGSMNYS